MYKPQPMDLSDVELDKQLLELTEKIAQNVHDNWAKQRICEGWTYGAQRDDIKKTTPCLVPYDELPESEKEFDRITALNTIKMIKKLGFQITKEKITEDKKLDNLKTNTSEFRFQYEMFINACDTLEVLREWNLEEDGEMEVFYQNEILSVIISLIVSDGEISQKEVDFLNLNFGFSYTVEDLQMVYDSANEEIDSYFDNHFMEGVRKLENINKNLSDSYKDIFNLICKIIAESDNIVSQRELEKMKSYQQKLK